MQSYYIIKTIIRILSCKNIIYAYIIYNNYFAVIDIVIIYHKLKKNFLRAQVQARLLERTTWFKQVTWLA